MKPCDCRIREFLPIMMMTIDDDDNDDDDDDDHLLTFVGHHP